MSDPPPNRRSSIAEAYGWASRIMTVSLEMVVPGCLGLGVDFWLGTKVLFGLAGFGLGMTVGLWHLIRMTSQAEDSGSRAGDGPPRTPDE